MYPMVSIFPLSNSRGVTCKKELRYVGESYGGNLGYIGYRVSDIGSDYRISGQTIGHCMTSWTSSREMDHGHESQVTSDADRSMMVMMVPLWSVMWLVMGQMRLVIQVMD